MSDVAMSSIKIRIHNRSTSQLVRAYNDYVTGLRPAVGNIGSTLREHSSDPSIWLITSRWRTLQDLQAHISSECMSLLLIKLLQLSTAVSCLSHPQLRPEQKDGA